MKHVYLFFSKIYELGVVVIGSAIVFFSQGVGATDSDVVLDLFAKLAPGKKVDVMSIQIPGVNCSHLDDSPAPNGMAGYVCNMKSNGIEAYVDQMDGKVRALQIYFPPKESSSVSALFTSLGKPRKTSPTQGDDFSDIQNIKLKATYEQTCADGKCETAIWNKGQVGFHVVRLISSKHGLVLTGFHLGIANELERRDRSSMRKARG